MSKWFTIPSGEHAGKRHLSGWSLTAIKTEPTGRGDDGWLSLAVCPICHALVIADERHAYGDRTWAHERWHGLTDYPDHPTDNH